MNKNEFITAVSTKTGFTKKDVALVVDATLDTIVDAVANDDSVTFIGFGKFEKKSRAAREGRNPQTGETITIPAASTPKFKAGTAFKQALN